MKIINLTSNTKIYSNFILDPNETSSDISEQQRIVLADHNQFIIDMANNVIAIVDGIGQLSANDGINAVKKISTSLQKNTDGNVTYALVKSFTDSSRSFITPDYSRKESWFYDVSFITNEVATTSDNILYEFAQNVTIVNLKYVTDRTDYANRKVTVSKNDNIITTGFSISYNTGTKSTVTFTSANDPSDIIKVSYSTPNSSKYELIASAGKIIKVNYVESQFSAGAILNDTVRYELILNNASTGNQDYVVASIEYQTAADYLNKSNLGVVTPPFGELTKDTITFPWDYQTGLKIKPIGDATTNPYKNEFNKLRIYLVNDLLVTNCDIATGTLYCLIDTI